MDGDLHGCFVRLGVMSRPGLGQSDAVLVCKRILSLRVRTRGFGLPRGWDETST